MFENYIPKNNTLFQMFAKLEASQLPMFYSVYLGIKPLMDTFLRYDNFLVLQEEAKKHGIIVDHNEVMAVFPNEEFLQRKERFRNLGTTKLTAVPFDHSRTHSLIHTFISRSKERIDEARQLTWYNLFVGEYQLPQPDIDNFRYGDTLGFPQCCVRFYAAHNGRFSEDGCHWEWNTPFEVYKNTEGEFSFLCNHIPMDHIYFLSHHYPCSYNCPRTIDISGRLLQGISRLEPQFAVLIEQHLKLPYLLFNEKKAFAFDGEIKNNRIYYSQCRFLGDRRDLETYKEITKGNMVEVGEENIIIYRGNEEIARYKQEGVYKGKIYRFV